MSRSEELRELQRKRRAAIKARDAIADDPSNKMPGAGPDDLPYTRWACEELRKSWTRILILDRRINALFTPTGYVSNGTYRTVLH